MIVAIETMCSFGKLYDFVFPEQSFSHSFNTSVFLELTSGGEYEEVQFKAQRLQVSFNHLLKELYYTNYYR